MLDQIKTRFSLGWLAERPARRRGARLFLAALFCIIGFHDVGAQPRPGDDDFGLVPPPPVHRTTYFAGVWQQGAEERRWRAGESPGQIAAPADLVARGFHLVDVEVWLEGDERRYVGVYRRASAPSVLIAGLDARGFQAKIAEQRRRGQCLTGFEAWREGDETLYAGVWARGCRRERIELGLAGRAFRARIESHGATHHLVDFEAVPAGAGLELSGLWRAGAEGPWRLVYGMHWNGFHDRVHALTPDGLQLADLEIHRDGKKTICSGFWRAKEGADWLGVGYVPFIFEQAHDNLIAGKGSGLHEGGLEGGPSRGGRYAPATQLVSRFPKLQLVALEIYPSSKSSSGIPTHGAPLHDSGTAGLP